MHSYLKAGNAVNGDHFVHRLLRQRVSVLARMGSSNTNTVSQRDSDLVRALPATTRKAASYEAAEISLWRLLVWACIIVLS